ncbi:FAD synthetase [Mesoplasma corruscae]|uniref:FAD synthase n=1 Tax=Mesoplasma corruscae TaxID=216874 RepID=A0A2S5RGD2_9MOLU|nr:FAD synthetase [Mesoplasma corruscae]PPE06394.1 bifunctional riboflavin kinase/FMN adenylyltransferase [Mesoplasma corruscae]
MQVIKTKIKNLEKIASNSIITVGMFDSLHIYHQMIINKVVEIGTKENLFRIIFTFNKKPGKKDYDFFLNEKDKIKYIQNKFEIDFLYIIEVDEQLANSSKEEFVNILKNKLGVIKIVEGSDFKFAYNKTGDVNYLIKEFGIDNVIIFQRNNSVSTSEVKKKIKQNNSQDIIDIIDINLIKKR